MLVLATYANEKGLCFPSNSRLAAVMGTSVSTVQRMLRSLKAEGELRVHSVGKGKEALRLIRLNQRYVETPDIFATPMSQL